jgi:hypothetical protein
MDVAPFPHLVATGPGGASSATAAPLAPQLQLCAGLFLPGRSACCLTAPPSTTPQHALFQGHFTSAAVAAVVDGWNKLMAV